MSQASRGFTTDNMLYVVAAFQISIDSASLTMQKDPSKTVPNGGLAMSVKEVVDMDGFNYIPTNNYGLSDRLSSRSCLYLSFILSSY